MTIRFRVWDGDEMFYPEDAGGYKLGGDGRVYCGVYPDGTSVENEEAIAMLSTGFKDKSGREIYDGDVVQEIDYPKKKAAVKWGVYAEEFNEEMPGWYFVVEDGRCYSVAACEVTEVVGNIHENPELLEDE